MNGAKTKITFILIISCVDGPEEAFYVRILFIEMKNLK